MALAPFAASAADTLASPWSQGAKSRARLVAAGGLDDGVYKVGVEITLSRNALTYWRSPGDAGVPPVFAFGGSANLADAKVLYPAPGRYIEGGGAAFGYRDRVVFPVEVRPADPSRPVSVKLDLNYAVCENICIPAEASMQMSLRPDAPRSAEAADIEAFRQKVPQPIAMTVTPRFHLWGVRDAAKPTWRVKLANPPAAGADLFAEGPDGWYFDTARSGDLTFDIILAEKPKTSALPLDGVVLTINEGDRAYEATTRLDAPAPKP